MRTFHDTCTQLLMLEYISQEDQVRTVKVNGKDVPIKEIMLSDETSSKCKITLWRELSAAETRPGDYIRITDVIPHNYRSILSLSATPNSKVEVNSFPVLIMLYCTFKLAYLVPFYFLAHSKLQPKIKNDASFTTLHTVPSNFSQNVIS